MTFVLHPCSAAAAGLTACLCLVVLVTWLVHVMRLCIKHQGGKNGIMPSQACPCLFCAFFSFLMCFTASLPPTKQNQLHKISNRLELLPAEPYLHDMAWL